MRCLLLGKTPVADLSSSSVSLADQMPPLPAKQYYNDTQEIDMEFLSREFDPSNNSYPVNLVLQSRAAAEAGYNAQETGNFRKVYLPFDPTSDFHEYRIDFLSDKVIFYADDRVLAEMGGAAVPDHSGHLILQHWSNGNPLWSGGPPEQDAVTTVSYVRAYFNSSMAGRQSGRADRCRDTSAPGAVCQIPSLADVKNPSFFSAVGNMTDNQTVSSGPGYTSEAGPKLPSRPMAVALPILSAALAILGA
jgi:hypothetical protein